MIAAVGASGAGAGRAQFCGGVPPERSTGRAAGAEPAPARQQLALGRIVREPKFRTPLPCPPLPPPAHTPRLICAVWAQAMAAAAANPAFRPDPTKGDLYGWSVYVLVTRSSCKS